MGELLRLLESPDEIDHASRSLMVDVVMARVLREANSQRPGSPCVARLGGPPAPLADLDAQAIDQLVESEWRTGAHESRAQAALELLRLIESDESIGESQRDALVGSTLDRIQEHIDSGSRRMRLDASEELPSLRSGGIRLADLVSVAAVVLIGFAVFWPMLANMREQARIAAGGANLSSAALGFTLYAADHDGKLPQANASFLRGDWWDVGDPERSHSANLYTLVPKGYASLHVLSSPGNPNAPTRLIDPSSKDWRRPEEVSFSYQLFTVAPPWGDDPNMVVLTDRSPVIERARRGERVSPNATSLNHPGSGQHVLFADGRVLFLRVPILASGDHLWIPRRLEGVAGPIQIDANQRPEDREDAYVGP